MSRFLKLLLILMPICLSSMFLLAVLGVPSFLFDITYTDKATLLLNVPRSVDEPNEVEPQVKPTVAETSTATPVSTNTPVPTDTPVPSVTPTTLARLVPTNTPVPSLVPTSLAVAGSPDTPDPGAAQTSQADLTLGAIKQPGAVPPAMIGKQFELLPPGSTLPSGDECATRVRRSTWEPRPENIVANHYIPIYGVDYTLEPWGGVTDYANSDILSRVDGAFVGTTDEILQWAACKWGIDEDIVRALAIKESLWYQSGIGDNGDTFGISQIKQSVFKGTYPASALSTAFNIDYVNARLRTCYDGHVYYLTKYNASYGAGDIWGCIGAHNSGKWYNEVARFYIGQVQELLYQRPWERPGF